MDRDAELRMVEDALDEIADTYDHRYWYERAENNEFYDELWNTLGEEGFLGAAVPEEYGGAGMGLPAIATVIRTLASHGVPSLELIVHSTMAPTIISRHASELLKERYLPEIASGDKQFCFGITEPDAGTNTYQLQTTATRDGDDYVLNGQKIFVSAAGVSDYIQVVTRSTPYAEVADEDPKAGFSLFVVDLDTDGVELEPLDLDVPEPTKQYSVFFEDAAVPAENRIGAEDEGFYYLFDTLNPERVTSGALAVGLGQFAIDRAAEYANERSVFDTPIGAHQGVQHPLAKAKIDVELANFAVERAATAYEADDNTVGAYANMAKYAASEAADRAVDAAIQTHGGYGVSPDYGVINVERFVRVLRIAPVNNEMILNHVAENVLGLPKSY
jgi:acyl-CoA dehydrogenase